MDAHEKAALELRRQRAIAQMDVVIDVLSAWRGRYDDDEAPVTLEWVAALMPVRHNKLCGWLVVAGTADTQGIGWASIGGRLVIRSRCGSLHDDSGPITRRQFREAARASGVSLPACHATLYLDPKIGVR